MRCRIFTFKQLNLQFKARHSNLIVDWIDFNRSHDTEAVAEPLADHEGAGGMPHDRRVSVFPRLTFNQNGIFH